MDSRDAVRTAILAHRRLSFTYRGKPRIVNPVRLGRTDSGSWKMRAIQVGGQSASGGFGSSAPKLFDVDQMTDVVVLDAEFLVSRQHDNDDPAFASIDIELVAWPAEGAELSGPS